MPKLSIIVITHNRYSYTKQTLDSLFATVPEGTVFYVQDNNSEDEQLKNYLTGFAINPNNNIFVNFCSSNLGWGAAVNQVLRFVIDSDYVLISNNDVIYHPGWFEKSVALIEKYPQIGIFGVWKHTSHAVKEDKGDIVIKDDMPGVAWLFKRERLKELGPFPEKGPCSTKGGNGEDTTYVLMAQQKGYWAVGPKIDFCLHIDGY
jgi:glycosyltransferase involved in cell wall biosynthesis